jgi:hypothetical protein
MPIGFTMAALWGPGYLFHYGAEPLYDIISHRPFATASDYVFTVYTNVRNDGLAAAEGESARTFCPGL